MLPSYFNRFKTIKIQLERWYRRWSS